MKIIYTYTLLLFTYSSALKIQPINIKKLPIVKEYNNINHKISLIEKNKKYKILSSVVINHGAIDIFTKPIDKILIHYLNALSMVYICNTHLRYILLYVFSILHFSNDFIFNIFILNSFYRIGFSTILHFIFIFYPNFCFIYLTFLHTPFHYYMFFKQSIYQKTYIYLFFISLFKITYLIPFKYFNSILLFPIFGHIMLNY